MTFKIINLLPVLDASTPVSDALSDADVTRTGAVVVANGSEMTLHDAEEFGNQDGSTLLGAMRGRLVDTLAPEDLAGSHLSFASVASAPLPDDVAGFGPRTNHRLAVLLSNNAGALRIIGTRQWRCSKKHEIYTQDHNGPCPNHAEGTLEPYP